MVFGSIVSSPRGSLSPEQVLELANVYLENAFKANDPDITLVLCHDTEVSLSQAKKAAKHVGNQTVIGRIAAAYVGLGKLLATRGHVSGAQASFKKAEKLGYVTSVHEVIRMAKHGTKHRFDFFVLHHSCTTTNEPEGTPAIQVNLQPTIF